MKPLVAIIASLFAVSVHAEFISYERARVVSVEPITTKSYRTVPRQSCTMIEEYRGDGHAAVTGAIVGGVIGRNVAKDKDAGTVVGAIVGSAIATENARPNVRMVERCSTYNDREYFERIDGYNVTFEYEGRLRTTRLDTDPGNTIRLKVVKKVYAVE
jgi:uncharacterized protein YcfJ